MAGADTGVLGLCYQNIQVLLRYGSYLKTSPSVMMEQIKGAIAGEIRPFLDLKELMNSKMRSNAAIWLYLPSAISH